MSNITPMSLMNKSYKKLNTSIDDFTFVQIFLVWISVVLFFGLMYTLTTTTDSHLFDLSLKESVSQNIGDSIYFSFVAATTTGFGDIVPRGFFKIIVIFEVISGLLLLAVVTSKFVSLKQDIILNEIYDMSFGERISRLRSSLLLFRQSLSRTNYKVEDNTITKRELGDILLLFLPFENTLQEILTITNAYNRHFGKKIDSVNQELLLNSVLQSWKRIGILLNTIIAHDVNWNSQSVKNTVNNCLENTKKIMENVKNNNIFQASKVEEILKRKTEIFKTIPKEYRHSSKK